MLVPYPSRLTFQPTKVLHRVFSKALFPKIFQSAEARANGLPLAGRRLFTRVPFLGGEEYHPGRKNPGAPAAKRRPQSKDRPEHSRYQVGGPGF